MVTNVTEYDDTCITLTLTHTTCMHIHTHAHIHTHTHTHVIVNKVIIVMCILIQFQKGNHITFISLSYYDLILFSCLFPYSILTVVQLELVKLFILNTVNKNQIEKIINNAKVIFILFS